MNYGSHRKGFQFLFFHYMYKSMRAIEHQGLCQFAPKELEDLSGGTLDIATF